MFNRRFSVAPMMELTDRHCRFLMRCLSKRTLLYTEMVTTGAILFGNKDAHLGFHSSEHPIGLQLGGNDPGALHECAAIAYEYGYDEVNLNVGCPSDRVQKGKFGACLMENPSLVAACTRSMAEAGLPVTVKCRIGTDKFGSYDDFRHFVEVVNSEGGCKTFVVHSRIARLDGFSPKQNREIPPLRHDFVYRLKQEFAELEVVLNGGVTSLDEAQFHLSRVDGVMLGRAAYKAPWILSGVDARLFGSEELNLSRYQVIEEYIAYMVTQLENGVPLHAMVRHLMGLYQGCPGARAWRRSLSENVNRIGAKTSLIRDALLFVEKTINSQMSPNLLLPT